MSKETMIEADDNAAYFQLGVKEGNEKNIDGVLLNRNFKAVSQNNEGKNASKTLDKLDTDSKLTQVINRAVMQGRDKFVFDMSQQTEGISEEDMNALGKRGRYLTNEKHTEGVQVVNVSDEDARAMKAKGLPAKGVEVLSRAQTKEAFAKKEEPADEPQLSMAA